MFGIKTSGRMMHVLPVEAYTSKEWYDLEMKHIFSKSWQFAGLIEDVAEAGDSISVQAGLNNIFIVKGRDNRLRAFHNMCRHRGTQLIRAVGKGQKALTCPYHDWTYDLEGNLLSVPKQDEEFPELNEKKLHECNLNLHEASVDIFKGMLFVHPDKNAPSIMEYFGEIENYLGPHIPEELIEIEDAYYDETINANWKIVAENYFDQYHLAYLHSNTLNMYDHANAEFGWVGPHYWFFERLIPEYEENLANLSQTVPLDIPKEQLGAYVPWFFPNIGITESEGTWSSFHAIPISPNKTRVVIRTKAKDVSDWEQGKQMMKSNMSSFWTRIGMGGKYEGDGKEDPMASGNFMAEDIYACEQQQKSLQSPFFSIGAQAQHGEYALPKFQTIIKEWIEKHMEIPIEFIKEDKN